MLQLVEGVCKPLVDSRITQPKRRYRPSQTDGRRAFSLYAAAAAVRAGGIHIFVADDRDAAAYLANDFYQLLDESVVYFFPSAYKRSIAYSQQDAQGVVQRTAALTAIRGAARPYIAICTYPEALAETVADRQRLARRTLTLSVGDSMAQTRIVERLEEMSFEKVEFVYQPGQYSVRGGIVDIFSYAESKPYRIDLFGDEIDSIRRFDISSQLSSERPDTVEIIPNMDDADEERISLAAFVSEGTVWFTDADHALGKVNEIRKKLLSQLDEPSTIDRHLSSRNALLRDMERMCIVSLKDNLKRAPRRHDNRISPVAAAGIQQELRDAGRRHNRLVAARLYDVDTVAEQDTDRTTDQHFPPDRTSQRRVPHAARRPARGLRRQRSENMRIHRSSDLRPLPALPHPRRDQARRADDRGRAQRLEGSATT